MHTLIRTATLTVTAILFAGAFAAATLEPTTTAIKPVGSAPVLQVVVFGKKMTTLEKAQFDSDALAQVSDTGGKQYPVLVHLAVK